VTGLSVSYPHAPAVLHQLHLTLHRGETLGIAGPSGTGKSTLAHAILGCLPPGTAISGDIRYHGRAIGSALQEPSAALHPMLTAGRHVLEAARARAAVTPSCLRGLAEEALRNAGLDPAAYFDSWPHQLSGGQKQRVLLAQAMVGQPELIVADEPAVSLDSISRQTFFETLRQLQSRHATAVLLISHSRSLLRAFASRVLLLHNGRLAAPDA
jgi:ABC-type glutathione transport system ATPase component